MLTDRYTEVRFLHQAWYVAAWAHEMRGVPSLGRTLLNEPVLLFPDRDGRIVAIGGRCPHRFAPLSMGRAEAGVVRCGYHGLAFDATGRCVHNPHSNGKPPAALAVRRYPLEERDGLLWIWMGTPGAADSSRIPRYESLDPSRHAIGHGYLHGNAHYQLMTDNILDLSHIEFLHPTLGTDAVSRAQVEVTQSQDRIISTRRMTNERLPDGLARVYRTGRDLVNRTMSVEWQAAANLVLTITVEPADHSKHWQTGSQSLHLFTPETWTTTHYFYSGSRAYDIEDAALTAQFMAALGKAFSTEDKPMIEAQQKMIGSCDLMTLRPALLPIDQASVRARRILEKRIDAERPQ